MIQHVQNMTQGNTHLISSRKALVFDSNPYGDGYPHNFQAPCSTALSIAIPLTCTSDPMNLNAIAIKMQVETNIPLSAASPPRRQQREDFGLNRHRRCHNNNPQPKEPHQSMPCIYLLGLETKESLWRRRIPVETRCYRRNESANVP